MTITSLVTVEGSILTLTSPNFMALSVLNPLGLPNVKPRRIPFPDVTESSTSLRVTLVCVISEPYFSTAALMIESSEEKRKKRPPAMTTARTPTPKKTFFIRLSSDLDVIYGH